MTLFMREIRALLGRSLTLAGIAALLRGIAALLRKIGTRLRLRRLLLLWARRRLCRLRCLRRRAVCRNMATADLGSARGRSAAGILLSLLREARNG